MTIPDDPWWRDFVAATPARTGKLAVTRADGRPHITPIWIALDGDDVVFTTHETSLKAKALLRDPRAGLCVDDDRPPFSFVIIDGTVTISTEPGELLRWATVLGGRYMGEDQAEAYGRRNGSAGELLVRLTPSHVVVGRDIAL